MYVDELLLDHPANLDLPVWDQKYLSHIAQNTYPIKVQFDSSEVLKIFWWVKFLLSDLLN